MSVPPERRFELKVPLDFGDLLRFRSWLRHRGREFVSAHPDRLVNNVYFDAPDLGSYADNLDGISSRAKARLRWYGDTLGPARCRFELKVKRDALSHKLVEDVPTPACLPDAVHRLALELRGSLSPRSRTRLDETPWPTLFNRYRREYLVTADGIRLTVDTDMRYLQLLTDRIERARLRPSPVHAVVEFKFAPAQRELARSYLGSLPHHPGKHSKYVQGLGAALF